MKILKRRWWLAAATAVLVAVSAVLTTVVSGGANAAPSTAAAAKAGGLGQLGAVFNELCAHVYGKPRPGLLDMPGVTPARARTSSARAF